MMSLFAGFSCSTSRYLCFFSRLVLPDCYKFWIPVQLRREIGLENTFRLLTMVHFGTRIYQAPRLLCRLNDNAASLLRFRNAIWNIGPTGCDIQLLGYLAKLLNAWTGNTQLSTLFTPSLSRSLTLNFYMLATQNFPLKRIVGIIQTNSSGHQCDDAVREEEKLLKQRYVDPLFLRRPKSDTEYAVEIHGMKKGYRSKGPFRPKEESVLEESWLGIRTGNLLFCISYKRKP